MKKILATLFISIAFNSSSIAQWSEVPLPRTDTLAPLVAVEWPDSTTGYVFDVRGYYYKTIDAGLSWQRDSLRPIPQNDISIRPYKGLTIRYVDFVTPEFGIVSLEHDPPQGLDSVLYITNDGGMSWIKKEITLKDPRKIGSYTNYYSVVRPLTKTQWFLFYPRLLTVGVGGESVYYSKDQGDRWDEISTDTLGINDYVSAKSFILIDSLHQYKFYHWHNVDGDNSWVKMTTDGGKTWIRIQDPAHPLAEQYYRGLAFEKIHTVSDTGIAITMVADNDFPPGRHYGIVTKDIRYRDTKQGWTSFTLPWLGAATLDILHQDGITYAITRSSGPVEYNDSTWVVSTSTGSIKGIRSPLPLWDIVASSKDVLWAPSDGGQKLFRFDRKLVSVRHPQVHPTEGSLHIYPNPIHFDSNGTLTIDFEFTQHSDYTRISLHDLLGRKLLDLSDNDINPGKYSKTISLSSLREKIIPSGVIVTLSMNNQKPNSTILFISK